jgi:cytochrome c
MRQFALIAVAVAFAAGSALAQAPATPSEPPPAATPAAPAATPAPAAASALDLEAGEQSFKKCAACHRVGENARTIVGPELNGLDGRKAGTVEGFNYSDANKNSGITWNEATFKEYITDPRAKIPNTKMVFAGIKSEAERNNLWAFLNQFAADGKKK